MTFVCNVAYAARKSCPRCGEPIPKGTAIKRIEVAGKWGYVHLDCTPSDDAVARATEARPEILSEDELLNMMSVMDAMLEESRTLAAEVASHDTAASAKAAADEAVGKVRWWQTEVLDAISKRGDSVQKRVDRNVDGIIDKALADRIPQRHILVSPSGDERELNDEFRHEIYGELVELIADGENIMLVGPTGSGKTHIVGQAARDLKVDFGFISCTAGTTEGQITGRLVPAAGAEREVVDRFEQLTGSKDDGGEDLADHAASAILQAESNAMFKYVSTLFVELYEGGGIFLFDEMDALDANMVLVINAAISNGKLALPNRPDNPIAKRHPDFVCVAAMNTWGKGADRQYVGRSQLDESTLRRFRFGTIEMGYDENVERQLCPDAVLFDKLITLRRNIEANRMERTVTTADFDRGYHHKERLIAKGKTAAEGYKWVMDKMTLGYSDDEKTRAANG